MTELRKLIGLVGELPGKAQRSTLLARLNAIATPVDQSRDALSEAVTSAPYVWKVAGKTVPNEVLRNIKSATTTAKRLRDAVKACLEGQPLQNEDALVTRLKEQTMGVATIVSNTWIAAVQAVITNYEHLVSVGEQAQLPGAKKLRNAIDVVRAGADTPPTSAIARNAFEEARSALPKAVADLGLTGKGGEFLVAAARGEAPARALLQSEVQEFLSRHEKLWASLKVKLG